jgi:hypothetical protein
MAGFVLLSGGDIAGGLILLFGAAVLLMTCITLPLLYVYVYGANRTIAAICYVVCLMIVFPVPACLGNDYTPPDYVRGFLAMATLSLGIVPVLAAATVLAPFVRPTLLARRARRRRPTGLAPRGAARRV